MNLVLIVLPVFKPAPCNERREKAGGGAAMTRYCLFAHQYHTELLNTSQPGVEEVVASNLEKQQQQLEVCKNAILVIQDSRFFIVICAR